MNLRQLQVVLWKNLKIRKRHWFVTICESVLPALLFLLIAYARSKVPNFQKITVFESTSFPDASIDYDGIDTGLTRILYTKENDPFYRDIIYKTSIKFQIPNDHIKGFNSEDALMKYYYKNHNDTVIAIIFKGSDHKHFDYTIRYHDKTYHEHEFLQTSRLYSGNKFEPNYESNYLYSGLLSIQKSLDLSFIEQSLGKSFQDNVNVSLHLRKLPFPPHTEDNGLDELLREYLPSFTLLSFIFICPAILQRVVEEKDSGIKELMKMVGMKSWMLWLGWFINGMIPMVFAICYIVILLKVPFFESDYPPIQYTNGVIIFFFLLLYCMAANVFCFAISTAFKKPAIAMVTGILIWILSYLVPKYSFGLGEPVNPLNWSDNILLCLFPNLALHYGYAAMSSYEEREVGIQWNNIAKSGSGGSDDVTMLNVYLMLLVDIVFYWCITYYVDSIHPGKYGVGKSLAFPFKGFCKMFKRKNSVISGTESMYLKNVEDGGDNKKGIEIQFLCKKFDQKLAVDNLNLDIYKNQITVLLGHNGAGKSTTMSMITGMTKPTSGSITINGKNVKDDMDEIRNSLGLCPQHNLLFTDLTVKEHLIFFAKLKGKTTIEADIEADSLLKKLNLFEKKNEMAPKLSGGMKRKLCLGMALIGGSKVLILDEPSSGMDPESRRELWDLLLTWKGEKTILITTHFMEEADALGDWIAIMTDGKLTCYGTPMFLKRKYDTGYHITLTLKNDSEEDKQTCINTVKEKIGICHTDSQVAKKLVFLIPFENCQNMASLLSLLEKNRENLGIDSISVTITTLEDVFLKSRMEDKLKAGNEENDPSALLDSNIPDITENPEDVRKHKFLALLTKRFNFFKRKFVPYLILTTISVVFFVATVCLSSSSNYYTNNGPDLKLQISSYKETSVYFNGTEQASELLRKYQEIVTQDGSKASKVHHVEDAVVIQGIENILYYKEHIVVGAQFSNKNNFIEAIALYNMMAIHSAPISLNLVTNSMAKLLLGDDYSITISNWPLESVDSYITPVEYSEHKVVVLWTVMIPLGCLFILASFILFPHIEISTKFVQLQYMCGVSPLYYWLINFLADMLIYLATIIPLALFICLGSSPFRGVFEFGTLVLIYVLYGMCGIPTAYIFSRRKSASGAFSIFIILGLFLGEILALVLIVMVNSEVPYYEEIAAKAKIIIFLLIPHVNLVYTLFQFSEKAVKNYNMIVSPRKMQSLCNFDPNPCCYDDESVCSDYKAYLPIIEVNLGLMVASCLLYIALSISLDTYLLRKILSRTRSKVAKVYYGFMKKDKYNGPPYRCMEEVTGNNKYNTLKATKLQKTYSGKTVVNNIDIALNRGDCLGILGVNGAGKTTTFRMLTREEIVDEGTVELKLNKKNIGINESEYLEKLGYCPQNDALNYVLTGREILTVIANLRGVKDLNVVTQFLRYFDLEKYADQPCGQYSGGNKRKLSLAVSLIGYRNIVLLDEPTNGIDPSARRKCWSLIKNVQTKRNMSFILTSHSMMECEALCNDLKIMKNGTFHRQGTISKLKNEFGGFSIKLKLKNQSDKLSNLTNNLVNIESETNLNQRDDEHHENGEGYDEVDSVLSCTSKSTDPLLSPSENSNKMKFKDVDELLKYFKEKGELKDKHSGLLHFYIKDQNKKWSTIFEELENIKELNPDLVEDYEISEASLEDVFLDVARSNE